MPDLLSLIYLFRFFMKVFIPFLAASLLLTSSVVNAEEYVFSADRVVYDEDYKITVAVGNVEITGNKESVFADSVTFFEQDKTIHAEGNVALKDKEGNIFYTDVIVLKNDGEDVVASGIRALMEDQSRLSGENGAREGSIVRVEDAYYTPCTPCEETGDVTWSLQAEEVSHNAEEHYLEYKNAWMELYGVPVFWTPYLTHPDKTVKRKSGLVRPTYGFKSDLGWIVGGAYYFSMAPDYDMTVGLRVTGDQGPVGDVEYRQRFEKGELFLRGSLAKSDRKKNLSGVEILDKDKVRGHIEGSFSYHLDDKWRLGFDVFKASDDQYARLYDYTEQRIFENRIYAERFDDRDYTSAEMLYFQDTRLGDRSEQPAVLPWLEHDAYAQSPDILGGRWHLNSSFWSLQRSDGQDVTRLSLLADWDRRLISDSGLVTSVNLSASTDVSYTNDRFGSLGDPLIDDSSFDLRFYPQMALKTSYPVSKRFEKSQLVVEPILGFMAGTNLKEDYEDLPNEDSKDILFGWSNLFLPNRYPGRDRIEDGARFNYGLRTGVSFDSGSYANIYAGQSYRVEGGDIYPTNAGLDGDSSDVVGGFQVGFGSDLILDYNAQIDSDEMTLRRHEVRMSSVLGPLQTSLSYFYDKSVVGTNLDSVREQIRPSFVWNISDNWRTSASALYDLSPNQDGLIKARGALGYYNECFDINLGMQRNLTDDVTGDSEFELMLTLGFKNLGSFQGPSFSTE